MNKVILLIAIALISGCGKKDSTTSLDNKTNTFTNSLGMVFKKVNGVDPMVSIFETRVCDFERFVNETGYVAGSMKSMRVKEDKGWFASYDEKGESWNKTEFPQNGQHPVAGVNKDDALALAKWLTEKEIKEGLIKQGKYYRLPRNSEFDVLVSSNPSLKCESVMKRAKDFQSKYLDNKWRDLMKAGDFHFHWGNYWPATSYDGNFHDQESFSAKLNVLPNDAYTGVFKNFRSDGYAFTAPVGSYKADKNGLNDIEGNLSEIIEDYGETDDIKTKYYVRGSSWISNWDWEFFPTYADMRPNEERVSNIGFRLVLDSKN